MDNKEIFLEKSKAKVFDEKHRHTISFNIDKYNIALEKGQHQFDNLEYARKKAKMIKWKAVESLHNSLELFEKKCTENGGKVIWAEDSEDALKSIAEIMKHANAKTVVKSKSMVTEEIHLNPFLEKLGIKSIETDLGEYIQQLDGEPPYHIVTPAMHKSKEDIAKLFEEKLGTAPNLSPKELTLIARDKLRSAFLQAEVGITGGNFIIADSGAIALTENEGNIRLTTTLPKIHIAIVGIEKVIPSLKDLSLFWPLLSTHGTGQTLTVYNTILFGPKGQDEMDGPNEMYVILLDNGRTKLLRKEVREAMYCIRCGACLNVCPVYKNIGGHAYDTTYSGPIGSVITPHMKSMEEFGHLSFASSLCGACTQVCPVHINIHNMLLTNRSIYIQEGNSNFQEKAGWKAFQTGVSLRFIMDIPGAGIKNKVFDKLFKPLWGSYRAPLVFSKKTFKSMWKEYKKGKD
ncbi:MAG TPA: LutB/LldF family L-lactate oxidation iron-sulfur protein [Edaphocola sp.]|nr:LutB/LldF family L-lactate oxidation iron-sulfur protein [Edaphocola sp.]